jgi:VIT1/CCC1 family predicted Fe2+/Mn2+ transporter
LPDFYFALFSVTKLLFMEQANQEYHLKSSDVLKDIVIGMSDGLTVPFALAAGMVGAVSNTGLTDPTRLIIIAGMAEIAAGSIAMGLGGYLAGKTEEDYYKSELKREYEEVETVPDVEKQEVKDFFKELGFSESLQTQAMEEITKDKHRWVKFMMQYELNLEAPDPKRAHRSAFNIGLSYIVGGLIPLSPYFFADNALHGLELSAIITLICLFIFGYFKSKLTGVNPWAGALKVMLIGAMAASVAFGITKIIEAH